jgi:hypothetical protein
MPMASFLPIRRFCVHCEVASWQESGSGPAKFVRHLAAVQRTAVGPTDKSRISYSTCRGARRLLEEYTTRDRPRLLAIRRPDPVYIMG